MSDIRPLTDDEREQLSNAQSCQDSEDAGLGDDDALDEAEAEDE